MCCKYPRASKRCNFLLTHVSLQTSLRATVPFDSTFGHLPEDGNVRTSKEGKCASVANILNFVNIAIITFGGGIGGEGGWECRNIFGGIQKWSISLAAPVIPFSWIWQSETPLPPSLLTLTTIPPPPPSHGIPLALVPSQALTPAQVSDPSLITVGGPKFVRSESLLQRWFYGRLKWELCKRGEVLPPPSI